MKIPRYPALRSVPSHSSRASTVALPKAEDTDAEVVATEPDWPVSLIGKAALTAALLGITGADLYVLTRLV